MFRSDLAGKVNYYTRRNKLFNMPSVNDMRVIVIKYNQNMMMSHVANLKTINYGAVF